jgi:N-acetylneuraminic acid mutarotase
MRRNDFFEIFAFLMCFLFLSTAYGESRNTELKSPLPTGKMGIASVVVDGKIYVLGGITKQGQFSSDVEKYDTSTDKWTKETSMPTAKAMTIAVAVNKKIYVLGGRGQSGILNKVEIYDTASKSWQTGNPLPSPRWSHMGAVVDGKIYVIGGISGTGNQRTSLKKVDIYDPDKNTWSEGRPLPTSKQGGTAISLDRKIYVIGGRTGAGDTGYASETVDIYDPSKNSWSSGKEMPQARTGIQSTLIKNKIYIIGGAASGKATNSIDVYDPAAGIWNKVASMKTARTGHCVSSVGNRIYIIGGGTEMSLAGIIASVEMLTIE